MSLGVFQDAPMKKNIQKFSFTPHRAILGHPVQKYFDFFCFNKISSLTGHISGCMAPITNDLVIVGNCGALMTEFIDEFKHPI